MKRIVFIINFFITTTLFSGEPGSLYVSLANHSPECSLQNVTIREIGATSENGWLLYAHKTQWFSPLHRIFGQDVSIDFLFNALTFHVNSERLWVDTLTKDVWTNSPFKARCNEAEVSGGELFYSFKNGVLHFSKPIVCSYPSLIFHAQEGDISLNEQEIRFSKGVRTELFIPFETLHTH